MGRDPSHNDTPASRVQRKIVLDSEISSCRRCPEMNVAHITASAPGYGCLTSPVALIGQSLCKKCMETQIPFTGGSGDLVGDSIKRAGHEKRDLFISNAVHCHPPQNRTSHDHEFVNCSPFLHRELEIVRPRLVITLGRDAERVLEFLYPRARLSPKPFEPPRRRLPKDVPYILNAPHPSWIKRQHDEHLTDSYVSELAAAIRWGFG